VSVSCRPVWFGGKRSWDEIEINSSTTYAKPSQCASQEFNSKPSMDCSVQQ